MDNETKPQDLVGRSDRWGRSIAVAPTVATLKKAIAPETGPCGRKNMQAAMPDFASGEFNQLDG
jgi:hypothetical protein